MPAVLLGSTLAWLAAVAWSDWHRLRIPNPWLGIAAALLLLSTLTGSHPCGQTLPASLCGGLLVLGLGLPLFCLGWVAAGDVKLLAVFGMLFGAGSALAWTWALASVFAGLHIACWALLRLRVRGLALAPSDPGQGQRLRLPHGAHLALAAGLVLLWTSHAP